MFYLTSPGRTVSYSTTSESWTAAKVMQRPGFSSSAEISLTQAQTSTQGDASVGMERAMIEREREIDASGDFDVEECGGMLRL